MIVGHFLQKVPRDTVFVATKSGYIPEHASAKEAAELVKAAFRKVCGVFEPRESICSSCTKS